MAVKRKKKPKLEDKEQSRRFVETAKKLQVDETGTVFNRVINKLTHPKQVKQRRD